jgi:hypothetical protein
VDDSDAAIAKNYQSISKVRLHRIVMVFLRLQVYNGGLFATILDPTKDNINLATDA